MERLRNTGSALRNRASVLIVEDYEPLRESMRLLLESSGVGIVAEAGQGDRAVERAAAVAPDLVVMNLCLPGLDGVEATRLLLAKNPRARILIFTALDEPDRLVDALRAGASGCLVKGARADDLLDAMDRVLSDGVIFTPGIARWLLRSAGKPDRRQRPLTLSGTESYLLTLMASGVVQERRLAETIDCKTEKVQVLLQRILAKLQELDGHRSDTESLAR